MPKQTFQSSQTPSQPENDTAEVFSVSQDCDGSLHFSRKDFITFSLAIGGSLLVKGLCPRFGTGSNSRSSQPAQAGMAPVTRVYVHAKPRIDSNILDTLKQNDFIQLIRDHPELDWVEVVTQAGQQGWLKRGYIDFSGALSQPPEGYFADNARASSENAVYLPIVTNSPAITPSVAPTNEPTATPCPSHDACTVDTPCTCDAYPCGCVADVCLCNAYPCTCDAYPCGCVADVCLCNAYPCTCNAYPCGCVAYFCPIT